jgi:hypothetical protein
MAHGLLVEVSPRRFRAAVSAADRVRYDNDLPPPPPSWEGFALSGSTASIEFLSSAEAYLRLARLVADGHLALDDAFSDYPKFNHLIVDVLEAGVVRVDNHDLEGSANRVAVAIASGAVEIQQYLAGGLLDDVTELPLPKCARWEHAPEDVHLVLDDGHALNDLAAWVRDLVSTKGAV